MSELYAEPARRFVQARGGEVRTGAPATVSLDRGLVSGVDVRGERFTPGLVIAAVAWFSLPELFGAARDSLAGLAPLFHAAVRTASSPIVTVNLWFDRPVCDVPFLGLPGRPMQWIFSRQAIVGGGGSHLSLVSSGAEAFLRWSNDELVALATQEVTRALPDSRAAGQLHGAVIRERRATFSLAPGQPDRPATRTACPNLFLAGDWIDTGLPGTIESAVVSGHRAADAALERLAS